MCRGCVGGVNGRFFSSVSSNNDESAATLAEEEDDSESELEEGVGEEVEEEVEEGGEEKFYVNHSTDPEVAVLQRQLLQLKGPENRESRKAKVVEIVNLKRDRGQALVGEERDGLDDIREWLFSAPASELAKTTTTWEMDEQALKIARWQTIIRRTLRPLPRRNKDRKRLKQLVKAHRIEREKIREIKYYLDAVPGEERVAYQWKVYSTAPTHPPSKKDFKFQKKQEQMATHQELKLESERGQQSAKQ